MYLLNSNVFVAFGNKKALIYDLREKFSKIIWLNENQTLTLKNILNNKNYNNVYITELIKNNLLDIEKLKKIDLNLCNEIDYNLFSFAWIEITDKCNFSCIHCYGSFNPQNFYEMSLNDIKIVIKNLKSLKITNIQIIGGEPFILKNKLRKILQEFLKENFKIEIFTNGYYLNETWISFLKHNNIKIAMSVYSHKKEIHNMITNHIQSFDNLTKSIELLERARIPYRLAYVKMKYNDNLSEDTIQNKLSTNAKIKMDPIRVVGNASKKLLNKNLIKEKQITLNLFKNIKVESNFIKKNLFRHNCFAYKFYIDAQLNVYPCVMERRISYGNLRNYDLITILKENLKYVNFTKDNIDGCKECEFRYCCFDCRPDSLLNDFKAKPWYCAYNPKKGEWNE